MSNLIPPQIKIHRGPDPEDGVLVLEPFEAVYNFYAERKADSYVQAIA